MKLTTPLRQLWSSWLAVSHVIGIVMSGIVLTILWILVFGAYAIVLKIPSLFAKKTKTESFWWNVSGEESDFRHQF